MRKRESLVRRNEIEEPMTFAEALAQLRAWCDHSQGEMIEIAPGITGSFQSRGTYPNSSVRRIEDAMEFELPPAYYEFMDAIGKSSLFGWSPAGGHWYFYDPRQVVEVSQH